MKVEYILVIVGFGISCILMPLTIVFSIVRHFINRKKKGSLRRRLSLIDSFIQLWREGKIVDFTIEEYQSGFSEKLMQTDNKLLNFVGRNFEIYTNTLATGEEYSWLSQNSGARIKIAAALKQIQEACFNNEGLKALNAFYNIAALLEFKDNFIPVDFSRPIDIYNEGAQQLLADLANCSQALDEFDDIKASNYIDKWSDVEKRKLLNSEFIFPLMWIQERVHNITEDAVIPPQEELKRDYKKLAQTIRDIIYYIQTNNRNELLRIFLNN